MDVLEGLNPVQREAVEAIEGPLLIIAGPGSGKTRVITHRIAYLVRVVRVNPRRIMAVTFTNKAAREMKERLYQLLGPSVEQLTVGTFHSVCTRILRVEGKAAGLESGFVIYDDADQQSLIKRCLQNLNIDPKKYAPRAFISAISSAKSQLISPEDYAQHSGSYFEELIGRVYKYYQSLLNQSRALDFDDLIMRTCQLFQNHPEVLEKYQSRYLHLLVDEFQDTNVAQYTLVRQLSGKYRNICVVGDPDQSIYSWRHADLRNILYFERDYPEAKVVLLEQNYRSTRTILEAAHNVISFNRERKEKMLWTENDPGSLIRVVEKDDEVEEAQFVANEVERLISKGEAQALDCAVMYRTNAQSRVIEENFMRYGIPYQIVGSVRFYERREIKDVLAYLKLIYNPYDSVSFMRIINTPGRGIGQQTLDKLSQWTKTSGISLYTGLERLAEDKSSSPFSSRATHVLMNFFALLQELIEDSKQLNVIDLLDSVLKKSGYSEYIMELDDGEDRWDNILELRGVARDYESLEPGEGLPSFLENVALVSGIDELDEKKDLVTLITLHQTKGLEFPVVFIVGVEEGVLPHIRSMDDPGQMEEERRLCYVGMTRSERRLYIIHAFRRSLMGRSNANPPSRFIDDIPSNLIDPADQVEPAVEPAGSFFEPVEAKPLSYSAPLVLEAGDSVRHTKFGEGVVISCTPDGGDYQVAVAFKGVGEKRLLLSLARLEKVE
ncbi:ATP-dependent helicase [Chloroflexota bacterium]